MAKKDNKKTVGKKAAPRRPQGGHKPGSFGKSAPRTPERPAFERSHDQRQGSQGKSPRGAELAPRSKDGIFLFGRHAVEAALRNPARECVRLIGTAKALTASDLTGIRPRLPVETIEDDQILRSVVPSDSPHQGLLLEVRPLPGLDLMDLRPIEGRKNIILMLDQVTDPHNVGACLRSAAAFGARALITQDRNSPSESGVLARASAGGLELLPWLHVANLSQALDKLRDMGYWHVGLDGHTELGIADLSLGDNIVIVMGSEGKGLRPLVRKQCDAIAKIPMSGKVESLNVSNAAAIALYELGK